GQLLVVMSYIASVYSPLEAISYTIGALQDHFISLEMAFRLKDTQPDIADAPGAVALTRARGRVAFQAVSFRYSRRAETLKELSFAVEPGQVVAIVGPTGAGKTTLISLIPRFYEPQRGRVLVDGHDVRDLTL